MVLLKFLCDLLALYFEILSFLSSALYLPILKFAAASSITELSLGLRAVLKFYREFCKKTKKKKEKGLITQSKLKQGINENN